MVPVMRTPTGPRGTTFVNVCLEMDDESELTFVINAGGGIETRSEIAGVLLLAVAELTGVDPTAYAAEIDITLVAAGQPPLFSVSPE
jgi:hypothetical protein